MLENKLIEHCAPTLAGMKAANLFNYRFRDLDSLKEEISKVNEKLNRKGVFVKILRMSETHSLLYVYRRNLLELDLMKPEVREILKTFEYPAGDLEVCLGRLCQRVQEEPCFPHEIGLFLSYPVSDVMEFIRQKGKNCKCCGVWSVYCNEQEAKRIFQKFRKCTTVYQRVFAAGREITKLTVTAA
ncbi:MAG: DUF3793 family protein [Lachnospiraceae bacterium]|nr:DUF3793 family protein [Lachnospiraceae bacterium]